MDWEPRAKPRGPAAMNRDSEFRRILRGRRAGIISEDTFALAAAALNGNAQNPRLARQFRLDVRIIMRPRGRLA